MEAEPYLCQNCHSEASLPADFNFLVICTHIDIFGFGVQTSFDARVKLADKQKET